MKREVKLKRREMKKRIKYLEQQIDALNSFGSYYTSYYSYDICPVEVAKTYPNIFNDDLNDEFIKEDLAYAIGMFLLEHSVVDFKKEKFDDFHTRYVVKTYGIKKRG